MKAITDTIVNDGVIDLDNQGLRNLISDVELSLLELRSDTTQELPFPETYPLFIVVIRA